MRMTRLHFRPDLPMLLLLLLLLFFGAVPTTHAFAPPGRLSLFASGSRDASLIRSETVATSPPPPPPRRRRPSSGSFMVVASSSLQDSRTRTTKPPPSRPELGHQLQPPPRRLGKRHPRVASNTVPRRRDPTGWRRALVLVQVLYAHLVLTRRCRRRTDDGTELRWRRRRIPATTTTTTTTTTTPSGGHSTLHYLAATLIPLSSPWSSSSSSSTMVAWWFRRVLQSWGRTLVAGLVIGWLTSALLQQREVRRRQSVDATSEWERYAQQPGARGRALMWLLMGQVGTLYGVTQLCHWLAQRQEQPKQQQQQQQTTRDDPTTTKTNIDTMDENTTATSFITSETDTVSSSGSGLSSSDEAPSSSFSSSRWSRYAARLEDYTGQLLTTGLLQLGPLYCKLGQIISCQEQLLPPRWIPALERLQDQIPARTGPQAVELAHAAWNDNNNNNNNNDVSRTFENTFSDFDPQPLAAASLGQVHTAVYRENNTTVALKLQRPYLREIYDQDLALLTKIARLVDRFAGSRGNVGGIDQSWEAIFQNAQTILYREIDYRDEAENGAHFCRDFGIDVGGQPVSPTTASSSSSSATTTTTTTISNKTTTTTALARNGKPLPSAAAWLRAPYVYEDLSSEKVLVMEYVPSLKITKLDDDEAAPIRITSADKEYLADCLGRAYLRQFCAHRFFSTDPHPGNLGCEILDPEGTTPASRVRLVCYDFGQAASLTQGQADGILDLLEAIVDTNVDKSLESFETMGVLQPNANRTLVRAKVAENYRTGKIKANRKRLSKKGYNFAESNSGSGNSTINTTNSLNDDDPIQVQDREVMSYFTLPAEYAFVGRALSQLTGVGQSLDPDFDFVSAAAPWIYEIKGADLYLQDEASKQWENFQDEVKRFFDTLFQ